MVGPGEVDDVLVRRRRASCAAAAGLRLRDAGGAVIEEPTDSDAALLTPAHQFPLGPALAPSRRNQVIQWAADTDA